MEAHRQYGLILLNNNDYYKYSLARAMLKCNISRSNYTLNIKQSGQYIIYKLFDINCYLLELGILELNICLQLLAHVIDYSRQLSYLVIRKTVVKDCIIALCKF